MNIQLDLFNFDDEFPMIINIFDFQEDYNLKRYPIKYKDCDQTSYGTIYMIINMINRMKYIGQTIKDLPYIRMHQHISEARNGSSTKLHQAIREFGWDNFMICWIHYRNVPKEYLSDIEKFYIHKYNTQNDCVGYNMNPGGLTVDPKKASESSRQWWAKEENLASRTGIMHWRNKRNPSWLTEEEYNQAKSWGLKQNQYFDHLDSYLEFELNESSYKEEREIEREIDFNNEYDMEELLRDYYMNEN